MYISVMIDCVLSERLSRDTADEYVGAAVAYPGLELAPGISGRGSW